MFVFAILSSLLLADLWSSAEKGLISWFSSVCCFLVFFVTFSYVFLGQVWYLIVSIPDPAFFHTLIAFIVSDRRFLIFKIRRI